MEDRYLFRGKRTDNGEWAIGNRIDDCVTGQVFIHTVGNSVNESDKVGEEGCLQFVAFEVEPSTICQCTGLKDKNGELIWEKDIVRHYNNPSKPDTYDVGLILFQDHSPGFERTSRMHDDNVGICSDCIYEVIGNKFDNPELLDWGNDEVTDMENLEARR